MDGRTCKDHFDRDLYWEWKFKQSLSIAWWKTDQSQGKKFSRKKKALHVIESIWFSGYVLDIYSYYFQVDSFGSLWYKSAHRLTTKMETVRWKSERFETSIKFDGFNQFLIDFNCRPSIGIHQCAHFTSGSSKQRRLKSDSKITVSCNWSRLVKCLAANTPTSTDSVRRRESIANTTETAKCYLQSVMLLTENLDVEMCTKCISFRNFPPVIDLIALEFNRCISSWRG